MRAAPGAVDGTTATDPAVAGPADPEPPRTAIAPAIQPGGLDDPETAPAE